MAEEQMVLNTELKMVVLLATALALGIGAVAACVVPWIYCKPPDADDDDLVASTRVHDSTDAESHTLSIIEENPVSGANIRINGISYVKLVVPPASSTDKKNAVIDGVSHVVQAENVEAGLQHSDNVEPMRVINSQSTGTHRENLKRSVMLDDYASVSKSAEITQRSGSEPENSRLSQSGFNNSSNFGARVLIRNEGNTIVRFRDNETSTVTETSSTESTNRTSSATLEHLNPNSTCPNRELSVQDASTKVEESRSSTTLRTSDSSNPTNESSIVTTDRTSTFQESENLSTGPTSRVQTSAVVESTKLSNILQTIPEVSTSPAQLSISQQLHYSTSRINATSNLSIGNEGSITSTSTRASNRKHLNFDLADRTPLIPATPDSTYSALSKRQGTKNRKISLSGWLKKKFPVLKIHKTPRANRRKDDQDPESIKSFSPEKKLPSGESTTNSEDIIECIRTRRSPKNVQSCTLHTHQDSYIFNNDNTNCAQFGTEVDEKPLDLSIHSSPGSIKGNAGNSTIRRKSLSRSAEACKEAFREVVDYVKVRKSSKSSIEGVSLAGSLMFSDEVSNMTVKDENQNVRTDSSVEFQRNSAATRSQFKREFNDIKNVGTVSESCTDESSYFEYGHAKFHDERKNVPCTEL